MVRGGNDIDERRRTEEALRQSEARRATAERDLQLMIDTIPVFVAAYEPDGTRSFVNQTWQQYMGLTLEEATGPNGKKDISSFSSLMLSRSMRMARVTDEWSAPPG